VPLTAGTRLGPYEITAQIGVGGMGEVYRATDTNLKRQVAIKVLPEAVAADAERLVRFQREAEVLASLNHPNIAIIHGLEKSDGATGLVMELVEGPTLADRIAQGPIPIDEALPIAKQIAEALEAAHEQGIIHRDLKPANIKVRPDGTVKVLDFGLAKAMQPAAAASSSLSMSPTITTPAMTRAGIILGTAAYMAPEQARGKPVDKRADIWAFGVVLYEMLTGRRAFEGEDVTEILGRVVTVEPDWSRLPPEARAAIPRMLRRALKKDPRQRLGDIRDARIEIEEVETEAEGAADRVSRRGARVAWIVASAAVLVAVVLGIPSVRHLRESPPPLLPETRTEIVTPATTNPISFALSPDGLQIVFSASGDGASRLWLRSLTSASAQPLAGTEGAAYPFWSPDSRSVGFFADGNLKRLDIGSGSPQALANAFPWGSSWNADGVILFSRTALGPLFRISASGGEAVAATKLDRQSSGHRFPHFLPDGRRFLFQAIGTLETGGIYVGSLDSDATTRLTAADSNGLYVPSGWLLWVRSGSLVAQRLDLERTELAGNTVTVANPVDSDASGAFSVSMTGLVAYRSDVSNAFQLRWFDRTGKPLEATSLGRDTSLANPRANGRRIAVQRGQPSNSDIWLLDGDRISRFTFDAAGDNDPVWSPDGDRVMFDSNRKGRRDLYMKASRGAGREDLILESPQDKIPTDWSSDGRFIMYHSSDPQSDWDLWVLPLEKHRKPWVFLKTEFSERWAQFSPDTRWVAYMSNEAGRPEVYVRPFLQAGSSSTTQDGTVGQWQVSTAGGIFPRWGPDGKELYYIGLNGQMMAAPISVTGAKLEPGTPVVLFQTRIVGGGVDRGPRQYDVADGRFLINTVLDDLASPITLLQNWNPPAK
jgi:eukaryotic-like serine/threonine-protein kinase